ncbi:MAG: UPF0182 family protein, partial [Candidatus Solibacter usitatus]|nr:UPF0182 family protein [Candidatus Solibacter usitatus]
MRLDWTPGIALLLVVFIFLLSMARRAAGWVLDYQWWREMGQVETLINMVLYSVLPQLAVTLVGFVSLWIAHARGMKAAGTRLGEHPLYAKASVLGALFLAYVCSSMTASSWSAVLFLGGRQLPAEAAGWHDPVFQKPLSFYLFELPFYDMMLGVLLILTIVSGLAYAGAFLFWSAKLRGPRVLSDGSVEWPEFDFGRILHSSFTKAVLVLFLITFAAERFLDRYDLLTGDHGFMVGVDYIDEHIKLPLRWLTIAATLASIGLVITSKWRVMAISLVAVILVEKLVPTVVHGVYVRPNEISLEKPYIQRHIAATRSAFTLDRRAKEFEHKARLDARIDPNKNKAIFDNVRLWDWRAFHDTVTQIQALRPYYVFHGTDVDRYQLDGELRQVLLTPRELDVRQLPPDARSRWMNPHFIYTHGYGMVLAEANKITPDGLPVLYIQNAPAEVKTKDLRLTRPEIYYGEIAHEPIFVRSGQPEFNYPSGAENVHTRYEGKGGFPIASLALRLAATVAHADWNILLTGFLTGESRMMIRRNVHARVEELAGFLHWDPDAYMVITPEGRLVWMMDGYTKSDAHPYSLRVRMGGETVNYLRNAVKATVDAYDGEIRFYIFDEQDPIIRAYAALFPKLFRKAAEMPPSLREHARYPLTQFQVQAEIYRTFHMRDAE